MSGRMLRGRSRSGDYQESQAEFDERFARGRASAAPFVPTLERKPNKPAHDTAQPDPALEQREREYARKQGWAH